MLSEECCGGDRVFFTGRWLTGMRWEDIFCFYARWVWALDFSLLQLPFCRFPLFCCAFRQSIPDFVLVFFSGRCYSIGQPICFLATLRLWFGAEAMNGRMNGWDKT
jgi:hypothetical protein